MVRREARTRTNRDPRRRRVAGTANAAPRTRPHGLLWAAFRLPVALYRLRLGWVLGHRFLMLTHHGRRTGNVRRTALEVVRYDPRTRECVVVAAWGEHADWVRNIGASPALVGVP